MAAAEVNILTLPEEILETVLLKCSYDDISNARLVCRQFNEVSKGLLNQGFTLVDRLHAQVQRDVKSKLPRRESERRNHPLAKHVNVLSSVETRLSLLSMTFVKYIDMNLCCFIPGKVLDELLRVLRAVSKPDLQPRAHELLQELRDISSMAMEHFEEKMVPQFKPKMPPTPDSPFNNPMCSTSANYPGALSDPKGLCIRPVPMRKELHQLRTSLRSNSTALANLRKDVSKSRKVAESDRASSIEQGKRIAELGRGLAETQKQVLAQEVKFTEMNRRMDEQDRNYLMLSQAFEQFKENVKDQLASSATSPPVEPTKSTLSASVSQSSGYWSVSPSSSKQEEKVRHDKFKTKEWQNNRKRKHTEAHSTTGAKHSKSNK